MGTVATQTRAYRRNQNTAWRLPTVAVPPSVETSARSVFAFGHFRISRSGPTSGGFTLTVPRTLCAYANHRYGALAERPQKRASTTWNRVAPAMTCHVSRLQSFRAPRTRTCCEPYVCPFLCSADTGGRRAVRMLTFAACLCLSFSHLPDLAQRHQSVRVAVWPPNSLKALNGEHLSSSTIKSCPAQPGRYTMWSNPELRVSMIAPPPQRSAKGCWGGSKRHEYLMLDPRSFFTRRGDRCLLKNLEL